MGMHMTLDTDEAILATNLYYVGVLLTRPSNLLVSVLRHL